MEAKTLDVCKQSVAVQGDDRIHTSVSVLQWQYDSNMTAGADKNTFQTLIRV